MQQSLVNNSPGPAGLTPGMYDWLDEPTRSALLKAQSLELRRMGYDGHNRQPQPTPIRVLRWRRARRRWNARCRHIVFDRPVAA